MEANLIHVKNGFAMGKGLWPSKEADKLIAAELKGFEVLRGRNYAMSTRCRHDLLGCNNQLKNISNRWNDSVLAVGEFWSDATAKKFQEENLSTINECFVRLMAGLQEATELVRKIEKRVGDPNRDS